ncbi:ABC transporter substrate-binding protein [Neopusillimonas aestuarii]|uniref:ABC transporter substrate-binding protein n=1 Tax=Neopusillimonas aestuarii TaxID=2716226 RepID=UPI00197CC8D4|nr:ABC transporter substrate-binding protein [Pusillimonas sp. DMV24BSW_D]
MSFSMLGAANADTVKIGVNQPLTGPIAASGNYVLEGAKIAADEINAAGGVNGNKIELVVEDNKGNPTESANVTEKLIVRDKVPVILGAWGSTLTLAAMPKLMEYKVPMVVETSSSVKITKSGNPYVFRIAPTSAIEADNFVEMIKPLGIKKADMLVVNNDWGRGAAAEFRRVLEANGVEVGKELIMDAAAQDMSSQLSEIKGTDADTLFVTTAVEQLTLLLKQAQSLGIDRQIITTGGSQNPDQLIDHAGSAAEGSKHLLFFTPWVPEETANPEMAKAFIAEWEKRGLNKAGLTESFRGYDGIKTIAAALKKVEGEPTAEKITKALWEVDLAALNGNIKFRKDGGDGAKASAQYDANTYLVEIKDGKVVMVQ